MKDIIAKLKQSAGPLVLGWILTIWLPVPHQVRHAARTAVNAVLNGARAVVATVQQPQQQAEGKS